MKLIRTCSRQVLALCAIALGSSLAMPTVRDGRAADISWIAGSGDWNTAANWPGGVVPTGADDVTIDQPGDLQIRITSMVSVDSLNSQEAIFFDDHLTSARLAIATDSTMAGGLTMGTVDGSPSPVIYGPGHLTIDGLFLWQRGFFAGPGTTTLASNSTTMLTGENAPALFNGTLENAGNFNYYTDAHNEFQLSGGTLKNLAGGVFNLYSLATANKLGNGGLFENAGTFNKYGSGDFTSNVEFDNSGTINLFDGRLLLTVASSNSGTINVPTTAGLTLSASYTNSGNINVHESPSSDGPSVFVADMLNNTADGHVNFLSGFSNLTGTLNQAGEIHVAQGASLTFSGMLNAADGSKITGAGNVVFNSAVNNFAGSLEATGNVTVAQPIAFTANQSISANLSLNSDLEGAGNVSISRPLTWTTGMMSGSGKTTIEAGATSNIVPMFSGSLPAPTLSRVYENAGTTNLLEADALGVSLSFSGGTINNVAGGVFNITTYQSAGKFTGTGALNNAGTLNVASGSGLFDFGPIALDNTGTVNFFSGGVTASLNNSGAMNVYSSALNVSGVNSGAITFFNSSSNFSAATLTNSGVLKASFGTLNIVNARGISGEINAGAQTIVSVNGSAGAAQNATAKIIGAGNVTLTNFTQYAFAGSLQSTGDITISKTVNIDADQTIVGRLVMAAGTLGGSGNITVARRMDLTSGTLGGSGKLTISEHGAGSIAGAVAISRQMENDGNLTLGSPGALQFSNGSLTNGPTGSITISGGSNWMTIGAGTNSFNNQGILTVEGQTNTATLSIVNLPFTNSGTIVVAGSHAAVQFTQNVGNSLYTNAAGRIVLEGGSFAFNGNSFTLNLNGGSIEGTGTITFANPNSTIVSHGLIAPGLMPLGDAGPNYLQISAPVELKDDAITSFLIGGVAPGVGYSNLLAFGPTTTLGGTLVVEFSNGFESSILPSQKFSIIQGPPIISGAFLNVANGERLVTSDGFGSFIVHYGPNSTFSPGRVILSDYLPYVPGDFNFDGQVDGGDFAAWQANFPLSSGATLATGDADGDGDVDGADFVAWQTGGSTATSNVTVPEPKAGCLALVMLAGLLAMRRCF